MSGISIEDTQRQRSGTEPLASSDKAERPHGRRMSDHQRDPWLGRVVDSRYRVVEVIGRGGMGVVYKVEHQRMSKIAAMKVLHREHDDDPELVERFHREAQAVSRLTHPNTVQVFDFGAVQGALYLIMEYLRGLNLGALISRDGPLPFTRAAPMFAQICAALAEAHDLGVVHRDLKPENVLVTRTHRGRDFIKVLDFGLAKLGEREEISEVSERGSIVGTPYYMSPEQIRGVDVDARSDIYSLGALMYRVLTGHHAFVARTPVGVVTKHLTETLVPPSERAPQRDIAPAVDEIVVRAMAKKPADRYATINELLDALERAFVDLGASAVPLDLPDTSWSSSRPHRASTLGLDVVDDAVDYGMLSSVRLQRADLDGFERSLRRRWWVGMVLVPLTLALVIAASIFVIARQPEAPSRSEREPNDRLEDATLIASGVSVTGYLGKRISKTTPDHDYYLVRAARPGDVATIHVSELPNIDIEISLLDATGKLLARANEGGVAQDERIRRVRVMSAVYVLVTEAIPDGVRLPTENVSDSYTLTVTIEPASPERESEPNESASDATALRPGQAIEGYLDRRIDVDSYRLDGPAGRYQLSIDGALDVPLTWRLEDGAPADERQAVVELETGALIRLARHDRELPHGQLLPGRDSPYTIRLLPVRDGEVLPGSH